MQTLKCSFVNHKSYFACDAYCKMLLHHEKKNINIKKEGEVVKHIQLDLEQRQARMWFNEKKRKNNNKQNIIINGYCY